MWATIAIIIVGGLVALVVLVLLVVGIYNGLVMLRNQFRTMVQSAIIN